MSLMRRKGKLTARKYKPSDELGIIALYNSITGHNRTPDQHLWEWTMGPEGQGEIFILEDSISKEIKGHHGLIPLRLSDGNYSYLAGKTENTILHQDYIGTGIYFLHERRFFEEYNRNFDLLLTTSSHGVWGKIRKKMGYCELSKYSKFIRVCNPRFIPLLAKNFLKNKKLGLFTFTFLTFSLSLVLYLISILQKFKSKNKNIFIKEISEAGEEFDLLWLELRTTIGFSISRTKEYLKWRIFENPNISYKVLGAYDNNGRILGYCILQADLKGLPTGKIVDIVAIKNDPDVFKSLITNAEKYFKTKKISFLLLPTLRNKGVLYNLLSKLRFIDLSKYRHYSNQHLLVYISPEADNFELISNAKNWYYTDLFSEGFL